MKKCHLLVSVMLTLPIAACGGAGEQGPEGKQGPQGLQGDAGSDGQPGSDGEGCSLQNNTDGSATITCPDGSSFIIYSGSDMPDGEGFNYCMPDHFGPNCEPCPACEHGTCNDTSHGNGRCACFKGYTGPTCADLADGYMIDNRDKHVYKTTVIDGTTWMAENIAYQDVEVTCFANKEADPDFIENYGCLYTFDDAAKVCPTGWQLPTSAVINSLLNAAGADAQTRFTNLRAGSWDNGNDSLGFNALPAGSHVGNIPKYSGTNFGTSAGFWTSANSSTEGVGILLQLHPQVGAAVSSVGKGAGYSVRCRKK